MAEVERTQLKFAGLLSILSAATGLAVWAAASAARIDLASVAVALTLALFASLAGVVTGASGAKIARRMHWHEAADRGRVSQQFYLFTGVLAIIACLVLGNLAVATTIAAAAYGVRFSSADTMTRRSAN